MSDITSWPWPRIIISNYKSYLVSGSPGGTLTLSELFFSSSNYWGALPVLNLGDYADISEISIADFGPFYIVCTYGRNLLQRVTTFRQQQISGLKQPIRFVNGRGIKPLIICKTQLYLQMINGFTLKLYSIFTHL